MPKEDGTPTMADKLAAGLKRGFTYNGCTASPDFDFGNCCNHHDYDYQDMSMSRLQADNELAKCMARSGWKGKLLAPVYWTFVRTFGHFYWKRKQHETAQLLARTYRTDGNVTDAAS